MDDQLYVWIYPPHEEQAVVCGVLQLLMGRRCLFAYDPSWLTRKGAFPLAPDLPLEPGVFEPPAGMEIHPLFEDAAPDRWGRNIISQAFHPPRLSHLEYLAMASENRIGALGFSHSGARYAVEQDVPFQVADLPELIGAANALAHKLPLDDELRRLLRPGTGAGGARPKAIIQHRGQDWIAKFPAESDSSDVCAIEHASLALARQCGVNTVDSELLQVGQQSVLLVRRFDREGGRLHFVSARTMLIGEGSAEDTMGYPELADAVRRHCVSPEKSCHQLFRRMVVNVLIGNTDDHARNHAFLYQSGRWKLAPAYDVLPQQQGLGFHQLRIGKDGYRGSVANVLSECKRFLLPSEQALSMVADIYEKVRSWREILAREGVSQNDIGFLEGYVLRGNGTG